MRKHPDLGKKLSSLYRNRLNPNVLNNVELGKRLGVSKQAVSRWCRGTTTQIGDSIPDYQLIPLSDVFGIEPLWFTLSYSEFDTAIRSRVTANENELTKDSEQVSISMMPSTGLNIFGRRDEIELLNDCWQSNTTNVLQIIGFGGVGKSSLVNKWLSELSKERYRYATRVYAWSFHWQGDRSDGQSSGDFFIEHALQWFGDESPTEGTPWSKATRLAKLIRAHRSLLILDGIEAVLYAPDPSKAKVECPALTLLIKELASKSDGLCVLTSRMPIEELKSFDDGRVYNLRLENLSTESGVSLLKGMGLEGEENIFREAVVTYRGHPLSLTLLAGYLLIVKSGNVVNFRDINSLVDDTNNSRQVSRIMQAYLDWYDSPISEILSLICIWEREVSLEEVKTVAQIYARISKYGQIDDLSAEDWAYAVSLLEQSYLISVRRDRHGSRLDCHPMVRDYMNSRLRNCAHPDWVGLNGVLFEYLKNTANVSESEEMKQEAMFRAVVHGVRANRYEDSFSLYFNQIKRRQFSISPDFSHHSDHACIKCFFERIWDEPSKELEEGSKINLLVSAATNLIYLGRIKEALSPSYRSIEWFLENEKWKQAAEAAGPLTSMLIAAGELKEAEELVDRLMPFVEKIDNPLVHAMAMNFKGYVNYLLGNNADAKRCFEIADSVISSPEPPNVPLSPTISVYYIRYMLGVGQVDSALKRALLTFSWREKKRWQVAIDTKSLLGSDTLILGAAFLQAGDKLNAEKHLNDQIDIFRSSDEWLYLPTGLNYRAQYYIEVGDFSSASDDLNESLAISKRTGAVFGQWEAYLELANLSCVRGELEIAETYLKIAKELPGMGLYKFRDKDIARIEQYIQNWMKK